jgi:hypothetical protein
MEDGSSVPNWTREPTVDEVNKEIKKSSTFWTKKVVSWRFLESDEMLPENRSFRNAWVYTKAGQLTVRMDQAREIHKDHLRRHRDSEFKTLDSDYLKADEDNDAYKKKEVRVKKQKLRDITDDSKIESANTPEELIDAWPDDLLQTRPVIYGPRK